MVVSRHSCHLTLVDLKLIAALHNIPPERNLVKKCAFRATSLNVSLFSKPTYKKRIQAGHSLKKLYSNTLHLATAARLKIVSSRLIQGDSNQKIKSNSAPNLQSAFKEPITLLEAVPLFGRIGKLYIKVRFRLVENLAIDTSAYVLYRSVH